MSLSGVELVRVRMPLVSPFRTSFGTLRHREILLVRAVSEHRDGWGECVADVAPLYSSEYIDGCADVLRKFLVPALAGPNTVSAFQVAARLAGFKGHPMAKAALETAVLDAELRANNQSLAEHLGATQAKVPCGVSVGIMDSVPELLDAVAGYIADGYRRIKLKIEPGWDLDPVGAVRSRFGDDLVLQVDANASYTLADANHLAKLDEFDLLLIEQPLAAGDLRRHAVLSEQLRTPVCLDESIKSAVDAADAIALGACSIINIKPGRVGGYLEARRIHDVCLANDIPTWCGGMLESGVGRAGNLALAALPGCTLPGDVSASSRFWAEDITTPFVLEDGFMRVPDGPGIGVAPLTERLEATVAHREWLPLGPESR